MHPGEAAGRERNQQREVARRLAHRRLRILRQDTDPVEDQVHDKVGVIKDGEVFDLVVEPPACGR
jgi:hypothetical protein